jgi:hypothetical protein
VSSHDAAIAAAYPAGTRAVRVPGGPAIAWLVTGLATTWCALAAVCLLWPGLGIADQDAALPAGFSSHRGQFELLIMIPIGSVTSCEVIPFAG